MLVNTNELVHVIEKPLFAGDISRQFVGKVVSGSDSSIRVSGSAFVPDRKSGEYLRRTETRQRVVALTNPEVIVYILPPGTNLEKMRIEYSEDGHLIMTDGKYYTIDISEFDHEGQP